MRNFKETFSYLRHTYYVKVAAFNGQGAGPFSELLTVRPEPSLAMGAWEGGAGVEGQQQVKPRR